MYNIEKKSYGYKLTFEGFIQAEEMKNWAAECQKKLIGHSGSFGVFVDMRKLKPLPKDAQIHMQKGQKLFKEKGMVRSVVILDNATTKFQFKRIGKETGIYKWARYIDATELNWKQKGISWIKDGVDPDK